MQLLKTSDVPTGIVLLDRRLDGGLPPGSFVCIHANPLAMPEAFLYQFATVMKTYYFTTSRPAKFVKIDMEKLRLDTQFVTFIDVYEQYYLNEYGQFIVEDKYRDKEIFDYVDDRLSKIAEEESGEYNIIIDSLSFFLNLNTDWGLKDWLINKLYTISKEKGVVVYCHLVKDLHPLDVVNKVLEISDVVFDVEVERVGERLVSKFAVPKLRGKRPVSEYFRFYIEEGIQVDTSRDIA
ncbi:MAG: recombinase RecA [Archaeoglobus sp.]|uniref:RAD55 family ATPase n=1 Tax=Archaeoglobus sp. TaxID=1872626 RepID=UPI001D6BC2BA|nr:RAD55 family ATPase [Archaeoglobus sp.]MBO8179404.1 recombinase RecA [Archaeoglobus sp.]